MSRKNKFAFFIMLILSMGILVFELRSVNMVHFWHDLLQMNWWWLLFAVFIMIFQLCIEGVIMQVLTNDGHTHLSYHNAVRIPFIEQLFNSITPFSSGGQPAELIAMMQSGVEAGKASSLLLMKFVIYQMAVLVNFVLTMFVGFSYVAERFSGIAWLILLGFVTHLVTIATLLMIMFWYRFTKRLLQIVMKPVSWFVSAERYQSIMKNLDRKIDTFYEEGQQLKKEKTRMIKAVILTLIQLLFYYSIPYFILLALGQFHANLFNVMSMHVMIVMITSIFPIPGGTGGAEYSFRTLFSTFLPNASQLVLGMLLWRFITYYVGMFSGVVMLAVPAHKEKQLDNKD
ncbi:MAG: lysylphosphatidylglycerol synthase transmembrane domain-containing protein [Schleiferilactobacillus perolens]|uniref:Phosphatidylglycerol lysyltransferase n=1 Tax=Schleiferilactobacillus perolens DSM 12744 TaxID=1423792 RepID=A0A0R1MSZ7_9LACO|nr:lysylphosphatidylglycerol synthase transmembrane domain-containing protein [Schleiferilactobacillus perolens]KRL08074.1 membrane protein [Schleiferilactobacillus perolens DSM 12744]